MVFGVCAARLDLGEESREWLDVDQLDYEY